MPFDSSYLSIERGQPNSFIGDFSPAQHRYYSATDASTDVLVSGYFDPALPNAATNLTGTTPPFRINDIIISNLSDGLFPIRINQVTPTILTSIEDGDIADGSITFSKMQNIATDSLIGRDTAGTGSPQSLTVSGGLEFTGSGGIQRSAVGGDITIAAGSNTAAITAGVIVNADVNTAAAIAKSKLETSAALSVAGNATNATAALTDITAASDGQVLRRAGASLAFGTVSTSGIADANVTLAKLSAGISPARIVIAAGKHSEIGAGTATVTITATGVLATDEAYAAIESSANAVTIQKVTPTTNTITVLCSGDPDASIFSWYAQRAPS